MNEAKQATPHSVLIEQLMDSRVPKTEREHAARREIEMLREALRLPAQQAEKQEPVAWVCYGPDNKHDIDFFDDDIADIPVGTQLYTTPPASPVQEPVAWMYDFLNPDNRDEVIRDWTTQDYAEIEREKGFNVRPLYTAPRQWVGLTDEEVHEGFCHVEYETPNDWNTDPEDWCQQFARYLEAKLKEKNT